MGLRFRKRVRLGKGVNLNLSKSGIGISAGRDGARVGVGSKGAYRSVGIPGTGLYMFDYASEKGKNDSSAIVQKATEGVPVPAELTYSLWPVGLIVFGIIGLLFNLFLGAVLIAVGVFLTHRTINSHSYQTHSLFQTAINALQDQSFDQAIASFDEILRMMPNQKDCLFYAGEAAFAAKQYDKALSYYTKWLAKYPHDEYILVRKTLALAANHELEEAIKAVQSLPQELKDDHAMINVLAMLWVEKKEYEKALNLLKQKVGRKRKITEPLIHSWYLMGVAHQQLDQPQQALKMFQKVETEEVDFEDIQERMGQLQ